MTNLDDELKVKLLQETARMPWHELQTFFASGSALYIAPELDLVDIACKLSQDDKTALEGLIQNKSIQAVSDAQAATWFKENAQMWTLVIRPWVLVQKVLNGK